MKPHCRVSTTVMWLIFYTDLICNSKNTVDRTANKQYEKCPTSITVLVELPQVNDKINDYMKAEQINTM